MLTFLYHFHMILASGSGRSVKEILRKLSWELSRWQKHSHTKTASLMLPWNWFALFVMMMFTATLVQQVASRWDLTSVELANAAIDALGDSTGIRTIEQARAATYQEESERRRERLEDDERMAVIRATPGVATI
jgi:hypothetical protein